MRHAKRQAGWIGAAVVVALGLGMVAVGAGGMEPRRQEMSGGGPASRAAAPAHSHDDHDDHDDHDEHSDEVVLSAEAIRRAGITIGRATLEPLSDVVAAPMRVAFDADRVAHVGTPVSGRVRELRAGLGRSVKAGEALAVIESPELGEAQSDYLQKRQAAENLEPVVALAKASAERAQKMFDATQSVSLTEVQSRQREHRLAANELSAATMAATAAGRKLLLLGMEPDEVRTLEKTGEIAPTYVLRAPLGGTVIEREVTLGELVSPEKEALFVVADLSTVWAVAEVPERQVGAVTVGAAAEVMPLAGEPVRGRVIHLGAELTPGSRTLPVRIEVANEGGRLRVGMTGQVAIRVVGGEQSAAPVVTVPAEALLTYEGATVVFVPVAGEPRTFAPRAVVVGSSRGGRVVVTKGLEAEAEVVVRGAFTLKAELGKASAKHEH